MIDGESLYDGKFGKTITQLSDSTMTSSDGPTNLISGGSSTHANTAGTLALFANCIAGTRASPEVPTLPHDITIPDAYCSWTTRF